MAHHAADWLSESFDPHSAQIVLTIDWDRAPETGRLSHKALH
jgi:hypothetical protein